MSHSASQAHLASKTARKVPVFKKIIQAVPVIQTRQSVLQGIHVFLNQAVFLILSKGKLALPLAKLKKQVKDKIVEDQGKGIANLLIYARPIIINAQVWVLREHVKLPVKAEEEKTIFVQELEDKEAVQVD